LQITGKRKLILTIAAIFIVILLLFFMFSPGQKTPSTVASPTPTPVSSPGADTPYGQFPTGQGTLSATPTLTAVVGSKTLPLPSPTPSPVRSQVIGIFDWSKNMDPGSISLTVLPADIQDKIASNDPCYMTGLSDSWSNPFEKTLCGLERTFVTQIFEPLYDLTCNFSAAALATMYGSNITARIVNGECMIEDRK